METDCRELSPADKL